MPYQFLVDAYETGCITVVSVWSEFKDDYLEMRPRRGDPRGRSVHEQIVHQYHGEANGGAKAVLPDPPGKPMTGRPVAPMTGHYRV